VNVYQPPIIVGLSGEDFYRDAGYQTSRQYRTDYRAKPTACVPPFFAAAKTPFPPAVTGSHIGSDNDVYMTQAQLLELKATGLWECVSHSQDHYSMFTNGDNQSIVTAEIKGSKEVLESWGHKVESFVSPHNSYSELAVKCIAENYRCGFSHTYSYKTGTGGGIDGVNVPPINAYRLCRVAIGNDLEEEDVDSYKEAIDDAAARGGWLVFYVHDTTEAHATVIQQLLNHAASAGVDVVNESEALDRYENHAQFMKMGDVLKMHGFMVGADGEIRTPIAYTDELRLVNPDYPWSDNYCVLEYASAHLKLSPRNPSTDYVLINAAQLRPSSAGVTHNGTFAHYWSDNAAIRLIRRASFSPQGLADTRTQSSFSPTGAAPTKTLALGVGSLLMGLAFRNMSDLVGPTSYDLSITGGLPGVPITIASGVSVAAGTETVWIFDPNANSPIMNAANLEITATAVGDAFTDGTVRCVAFYRTFVSE